MKKSILFLVLLQSLLIFGQAPQKMTYQSVVRNSANVLLANQAVGVRISILEGSLSGTAVYSETHTVTTNANGLFTLEAGGGTPTEGVFADIVWGNGSHYIKSEIDPAGGTNYTLSATKELLSVPYALYAVNGITTEQADAITAHTSTITALQAQIAAMQAQITYLLVPTVFVDAHWDEVSQIWIGSQTWMQKNLNVTSYRNGDVIPEVTDPSAWGDLTTGAWGHYGNDPSNDAIYGKVYNWYAINDPRGLAPLGFHIPLFTDLSTLPLGQNFFLQYPYYGHDNPNYLRLNGYWWNLGVSENSAQALWLNFLSLQNPKIDDTYPYVPNKGFSVRCLKDEVGNLTTTAVANITATTVTSGGTIVSDGGATITQRGVVWSTSANPTIALATKTTDGSGMGSFTSTITGLTPATNYHLRAYATNSAGTSYGAEVSFTTPAGNLPPDMGGSGGFGLPDTGGSSGSGGSAGPNIGN